MIEYTFCQFNRCILELMNNRYLKLSICIIIVYLAWFYIVVNYGDIWNNYHPSNSEFQYQSWFERNMTVKTAIDYENFEWEAIF